MAAKKYTHGLPQYVSEVKRKDVVTGYKYQRRIPQKLQELHEGRKVWDLYLGKDLLQAIVKAHHYREKHDNQIAGLTDPATRARIVTTGYDQALSNATKQQSPTAPQWQETSDHLKLCADLPNDMEIQALAVFAATTFGDKSYLNDIKLSPMLEQLSSAKPDSVPDDGTDLIVYRAMKEALDTRLAELQVRSNDPAARITARMEQYIAYKRSADNTARGYRARVARFTAFAGDLELAEIDAPLLRRYRDHLINGDADNKAISNVRPYFYPIKALFNWALKEDLLITNPLNKVDLPDAPKSVEETKWQSFNDAEIATVWKAVEHAWGPDGDSRMDLERRQCFLVAFRVLLFTGMRPAEVFVLQPNQVQKDYIDIKKTKSGSARKIPLAKGIADFYEAIRTAEWQAVSGLYKPSGKMSDSFTKIIRRAGLTNDRHVLYSTKDTLVDRLERAGASENLQRTIIGHATGRGALRNYKTAEPMEMMRRVLNQIEYCDGLPGSVGKDETPVAFTATLTNG